LGTDDAGVSLTAQKLVGPEALVQVERTGGLVAVRVERPVPVLGRFLNASAEATVACEPSRGC